MSFSITKRANALAQPLRTRATQRIARPAGTVLRFNSTTSATPSSAESSAPSGASAASDSKPTHYLITLKRSPIGLPDTTKRTLASLGFLPSAKHYFPSGPKASANPKLHRSVLHPFSETCAGMILGVKELVEVKNVSQQEGEQEIVRRNGRKGEGRGWDVAGSLR